MLVRRLEHISEPDRHRFDEELRRLRADLSGQVEHLRAAEQITAEARGMSVGTARLQMFGLMLVGVGTVVLTVPSLFNVSVMTRLPNQGRSLAGGASAGDVE